MQNGQTKTNGKMNGHGGAAKHAPIELPEQLQHLVPAPVSKKVKVKGPPPGPFTFVDELPAKVRALVQGAVEATQADTKRVADRRYIDGLRRGAYLLNMATIGCDSNTRKHLADALEKLEDELAEEEKKLRTPPAQPAATT